MVSSEPSSSSLSYGDWTWRHGTECRHHSNLGRPPYRGLPEVVLFLARRFGQSVSLGRRGEHRWSSRRLLGDQSARSCGSSRLMGALEEGPPPALAGSVAQPATRGLAADPRPRRGRTTASGDEGGSGPFTVQSPGSEYTTRGAEGPPQPSAPRGPRHPCAEVLEEVEAFEPDLGLSLSAPILTPHVVRDPEARHPEPAQGQGAQSIGGCRPRSGSSGTTRRRSAARSTGSRPGSIPDRSWRPRRSIAIAMRPCGGCNSAWMKSASALMREAVCGTSPAAKPPRPRSHAAGSPIASQP